MAMGRDRKPDGRREAVRQTLEIDQQRAHGVIERDPVQNDDLRVENVLGRQVGQPLFQFGDTEALHLKRHDKAVMHHRVPQLFDMGQLVLLGHAVQDFLIAQVHLADGLLEADVQNIFLTQQTVEGYLHHQGGFADAGTGQNGAKTARRDDIVVLVAQKAQRISQNEVIGQHDQAPFLQLNYPAAPIVRPGRPRPARQRGQMVSKCRLAVHGR